MYKDLSIIELFMLFGMYFNYMDRKYISFFYSFYVLDSASIHPFSYYQCMDSVSESRAFKTVVCYALVNGFTVGNFVFLVLR